MEKGCEISQQIFYLPIFSQGLDFPFSGDSSISTTPSHQCNILFQQIFQGPVYYRLWNITDEQDRAHLLERTVLHRKETAQLLYYEVVSAM